MKFRILYVSTRNHEKWFVVQSLEPDTHFRLSDNCFLGGIPLKNVILFPPRMSNDNGEPIKGVLTFELKTKLDKPRLVTDSIVELTGHQLL